ncbi:glycosyltransferase family 39 protein [Azoarcus sp. DN11]|uniref:glycosyltransferase family 39 protein n=1 Tax=Azoarcus sp. DN11 TaxID=356837 RepID=UPI000EB477E0|nr:glycosyltransferase family 39 protein [Azoarcus sp. DN11]AYH42280.1 hypothetical protein CDA09_02565 [Azoarcus sp. DN11]
MIKQDTPQPTSSDQRGAQLGLFALCLAHVVIWTLVPSLTYPSVPRDTVEGIAWGKLWQLGYDKHPPLAPWLSAFVTDLFGSVGWPVYLASQLCIALTFWAVWSLAKTLLVTPWRAFAAVLLLEGVAFFNASNAFNSTSFILNPNVVMLPTWAMLCLTVHRAILAPDAWRWSHAGLWAGLAVLAKYETGILFVVLAIVLVATREGRRSLSSRGFYVGVLVSVLVVMPHLVWLAQHDFLPVKYALGRLDTEALPGVPRHGANHPVYQPLLFLRSQIGYTLPAALLFLILKRRRQAFDRHDFNHVFALSLALGPLIVAMLFGFATRANLVTAWGFPFYSLAGIALVLFYVPEVDKQRIARLGAAVVALTLALVLRHAWNFHQRPWDEATFPYEPLLDHVTQTWDSQHPGAPLRFVGGDRWTVAGMVSYSKAGLIPFFGTDAGGNPWLNEGDVRTAGAVFVHPLSQQPNGEALIRSLRARFPALTGEETIDMAPLSKAAQPPIRLWIGYLPPGQ